MPPTPTSIMRLRRSLFCSARSPSTRTAVSTREARSSRWVAASRTFDAATSWVRASTASSISFVFAITRPIFKAPDERYRLGADVRQPLHLLVDVFEDVVQRPGDRQRRGDLERQLPWRHPLRLLVGGESWSRRSTAFTRSPMVRSFSC